MKKREIVKRLLCLGMTLLLVLSLAACKDQADEQDSQPPNPTLTPTETSTPAPTPEPTPTPPIPYTDVPTDAYYYDAVVWAYQNGIASDGTTFDPDAACTRGQVVTSLWRAMGSPEPQTVENPISDISPDDWYYNPALWAYESGIITNTTFNPGNPCTNAEVITILWRAYGEPAAAVYSSPVSLANPDKYYTRAVAWADNGGMLAGVDSAFDPAAPCPRADLMMCIYWAKEQWTFTEEDKTVQAEYEQIINDAQLYEVHRSGLLYADYVDVDGDGKVELLTVGINEDKFEGTVTVYANIDGHAKKSCEGNYDTLAGQINRVSGFSLCRADGHLYLASDGWIVEDAGAYYKTISQFYKIEKDAVTLEYDLYDEEEYIFERDTTEYTYTASDKEISEDEFKTILQKFTDETPFYSLDCHGGGIVSISNRGLLPDPSEAMQKIYAAVRNGDFSFFAGTYAGVYDNTIITLERNGALTDGGWYVYSANKKPISITVDNGIIHCELDEGVPMMGPNGEDWGLTQEYYEIYPIGVDSEYYHENLDKIRIRYVMFFGGITDMMCYKVS